MTVYKLYPVGMCVRKLSSDDIEKIMSRLEKLTKYDRNLATDIMYQSLKSEYHKRKLNKKRWFKRKIKEEYA